MKTWMNWFAWYPVAFGPHIKWLTTIQRYYSPEEKAWYYRNVPSPLCAVSRVRRRGTAMQELQKVIANISR